MECLAFSHGLFFVLVGCGSPPQAATPAEVRAVISETMQTSNIQLQNTTALQQLEKTSAGTADAIKAIDAARDVSLNNLSNAGTIAFKKSRAMLQGGGKVRIERDFLQAAVEATGHPLDLAISGSGFFKIRIGGSGTEHVGYTRNGNFFVNATGDLVCGIGDGCLLLPPISVPQGATNIAISQDGIVSIIKSNSSTRTRIGQIRIARFMNEQSLSTLDGVIFTEMAAAAPPFENAPGEDGAGIVVSGFLESSNVDISQETLRLHFLNTWRAAIVRAIDAR